MRFVRPIAGVLSLAAAAVALFAGGVLWRPERPHLAAWSLLALGGALCVAAAVLCVRPAPPPREVVFVVEPEQVPLIAARLGVVSLSALGRPGRALPGPGAGSRPEPVSATCCGPQN